MSGDGSEDPAFVKTAGAAGRRGRDPVGPGGSGPGRLQQQVQGASTAATSGLYSTQSFDATNIFLAGIEAGQDRATPT